MEEITSLTNRNSGKCVANKAEALDTQTKVHHRSADGAAPNKPIIGQRDITAPGLKPFIKQGGLKYKYGPTVVYALNPIDFNKSGGNAQLSNPTYHHASFLAALASFLAPLPYRLLLPIKPRRSLKLTTMKTLFLSLCTLFIINITNAQHAGHQHKTDTTKKSAQQKAETNNPQQSNSGVHDHSTHQHGAMPARDTTKPLQPNAHAGHNAAPQGQQHNAHATHQMSHAFSRNLPMTRNGSGTSWLPDNAPMFGTMYHSKKWMYMLHGNLFLRYNKQDIREVGSRGDEKVDAPNWIMLMGQRNVGKKGLFRFSSMFSLDPVIAGGRGYPLLFQTGETYKGQPLIDRQHPHDLISELSIGYTHTISPKADIFAYVGYPGEPALGPTAFMHRPSALNNPDAPLSHHWVDATHITYGVATLGVRYGNWKVEGSSFTGREPGENRYNLDKPRFDSWSGRLSYNPSEKWALQASHAFIKEPEALHAGEDVRRTTASASYSSRGYGYEFVNFTALWGMNKTPHHGAEHAALLEGSYIVRKLGVYGRYEWVQKSVEELGLEEREFGHDALFPVHALTAGVSYDLFNIKTTRVAAGTQVTLFSPDKRLSVLYGQNPMAAQVYLRIYPAALGRRSGSVFLPY